jgi:hypothetical protein
LNRQDARNAKKEHAEYQTNKAQNHQGLQAIRLPGAFVVSPFSTASLGVPGALAVKLAAS